MLLGAVEGVECCTGEQKAAQVVHKTKAEAEGHDAVLVDAMQQVLFTLYVDAEEILHRSQQHRTDACRYELRDLQMQDVIGQLVLIWGAWVAVHEQQHQEENHPDVVARKQRWDYEEPPHKVSHTSKDGPVVRQQMVQHEGPHTQVAAARPMEGLAHAPLGDNLQVGLT
eukprot:CAMPEP_0179019820 /NCGR_PEP_ID=MMETSP0796-20121207/5066_1 /TAXON_ID=73915 /ORGANISM="Pyrodinium bahamense, Strain pbaha01" /LENGTH=168 /DNA_ID=CAMNT_0020715621 /DNA_START=608 /DNA_END=1114 /DNA_ORIENTATION=+